MAISEVLRPTERQRFVTRKSESVDPLAQAGGAMSSLGGLMTATGIGAPVGAAFGVAGTAAQLSAANNSGGKQAGPAQAPQPNQAGNVASSDGAIARRIQTDPAAISNTLKDGLMASFNLPDDQRAQASQPIIQALMANAQNQRGMMRG